MSTVSCMTTAISGLEANSQNLAIISDNIVNANTTGFKSTRGEFHSILAQDIGGSSGGNDVGRGVRLGSMTTMFTQGNINRTERSTDCAIGGNGFFIAKGDIKGVTFTRDGSFRFDREGWLTTTTGARVQAYSATSDGKLSGKMGDIRIPFNTIPASATKKVEVRLNLDARAQAITELNPLRPEESSNFTTAVQLYDSIGNNHSLGMYFNKVSDSEWEWTAMADGANMAGGHPGGREIVAKGTLSFSTDGVLVGSTQNLVNTSFANGAIADQQIHFDFGKTLAEGGAGAEGTTQYGSKNAIFMNNQDGWAAGSLTDTAIDGEGVITGVYTNGQNRILGQLALARFEATEKLAKVGENQFRETIASGQPIIGKPTTNGRGAILTKSLEHSNVDIAKEFVEMIKAQRGFQASAKSITTANEMLDEVMNIKRM